MKWGTIVLTKFPFTDLQSIKRRPAVVISRENNPHEDYMVAFITSIPPDKLSDTDLLINPQHKDFKKSGLSKTSVCKLDKLSNSHIKASQQQMPCLRVLLKHLLLI